MVHGLLSTPADETNERVSDPFWACAGALATMAMADSSAKPNACDFISHAPLKLKRRVTRDGCIIAQSACRVPPRGWGGVILQTEKAGIGAGPRADVGDGSIVLK